MGTTSKTGRAAEGAGEAGVGGGGGEFAHVSVGRSEQGDELKVVGYHVRIVSSGLENKL